MATVGAQVVWVTVVNVVLAAVTVSCLGAVLCALLADLLRRGGDRPDGGSRDRELHGRVLVFPVVAAGSRQTSHSRALGHRPSRLAK